MKPSTHASQPWWSYGHVWLVIAGPVGVVIACAITAYFVISQPETLVAEDYYQRGININQTLQGNQPNEAPAQAARNHAATGITPNALQVKVH
jgi:uncharacterized protein